jgi:TetR/AcrR family transcriptional repressor of mexJK operon
MTTRIDAGERLRVAGRTLFLRHGYAGTSTDAICREAKVSKETMYARYPRKEDLLADVLRHLIEGAEPSPLATAKGRRRPTLRQLLLQHAHGLIDDLMNPEYLALLRLLASEVGRAPELGEHFKGAVPYRVLGGVAQILEDYEVDGIDRSAAARLFVGGLLTFVLLDGVFAGGPPKKPTRRQVEAHVDLFLAMLPGDGSGGSGTVARRSST